MAITISLFGEHIDEVEWRPEQFLNNNRFTFRGRISVLPPCVFGDKNGSKWPLPDDVLSADISPLKLQKIFKANNSFCLGSKCNGYFRKTVSRRKRYDEAHNDELYAKFPPKYLTTDRWEFLCQIAYNTCWVTRGARTTRVCSSLLPLLLHVSYTFLVS